jgi:hypothetical protein
LIAGAGASQCSLRRSQRAVQLMASVVMRMESTRSVS